MNILQIKLRPVQFGLHSHCHLAIILRPVYFGSICQVFVIIFFPVAVVSVASPVSIVFNLNLLCPQVTVFLKQIST